MAYDALKAEGVHVELAEVEDAMPVNYNNFNSTNFNKLSYVRFKYIAKHLSNGEDVWYLDTDTVVLKDLNVEYDLYSANRDKVDIYFQSDFEDVCTGCMLFFANPATIDFCSYIYKSRIDKYCDQACINGFLKEYPNCVFIDILDMLKYPNGYLYFNMNTHGHNKVITSALKEYNNAVKPDEIAFVHANWMVGIAAKIAALKKAGLWYLKDDPALL
jgi:hypothetical protein